MIKNSSSYTKVRYIRDTNLGLAGDPTYRCSEIEVYDPNGVNIAPHGTVQFTCNLFDINEASYNNADKANNGTIEVNAMAMCKISTPTNPEARKGIILDLGDVYEVNKLNIRHSWTNDEEYIQNVVEISRDGLNWIVVQDSSIFGNYTETAEGLNITIPGDIGTGGGGGGTANIPGMTIITSTSKPIENNIIWFEVVNKSTSNRVKSIEEKFDSKNICKIKM